MKNQPFSTPARSDGTNTWTIGYDAENRQISYDAPGTANDATYGYDTLGRRVSKTVNGTTEKYLLDGDNVEADYAGDNALKATYVTPRLDDNLYVNRLVDGAWQGYYYFHDGLGSVSNIINTSNVLKKNYQYYAFGEMLSETGNNLENRYKFTSRELDNESLMYHYRARTYSPVTGRFGSRDQIEYKDGINLYSYVKNNPINYSDFTGLQGIHINIRRENNYACGLYPRCKPAVVPSNVRIDKIWFRDYCTETPASTPIKCPRFICPKITGGSCDEGDMIITPYPCELYKEITRLPCIWSTMKLEKFEYDDAESISKTGDIRDRGTKPSHPYRYIWCCGRREKIELPFIYETCEENDPKGSVMEQLGKRLIQPPDYEEIPLVIR